MLLDRVVLALLLVPASLLLFGCSHAAPLAPRAPESTSEYVTVLPSVTVSKPAQASELKQAALDPNEDVMAEILAIPPGQ